MYRTLALLLSVATLSQTEALKVRDDDDELMETQE